MVYADLGDSHSVYDAVFHVEVFRRAPDRKCPITAFPVAPEGNVRLAGGAVVDVHHFHLRGSPVCGTGLQERGSMSESDGCRWGSLEMESWLDTACQNFG